MRGGEGASPRRPTTPHPQNLAGLQSTPGKPAGDEPQAPVTASAGGAGLQTLGVPPPAATHPPPAQRGGRDHRPTGGERVWSPSQRVLSPPPWGPASLPRPQRGAGRDQAETGRAEPQPDYFLPRGLASGGPEPQPADHGPCRPGQPPPGGEGGPQPLPLLPHGRSGQPWLRWNSSLGETTLAQAHLPGQGHHPH